MSAKSVIVNKIVDELVAKSVMVDFSSLKLALLIFIIIVATFILTGIISMIMDIDETIFGMTFLGCSTVAIVLALIAYGSASDFNGKQGISNTIVNKSVSETVEVVKIPLKIQYVIDDNKVKQLILSKKLTVTEEDESGKETVIQMALSPDTTSTYADTEEYIVVNKYTYRLNNENVEKLISRQLLDEIKSLEAYGTVSEFHYNPDKTPEKGNVNVDIGSQIKVNVDTKVTVETGGK